VYFNTCGGVFFVRGTERPHRVSSYRFFFFFFFLDFPKSSPNNPDDDFWDLPLLMSVCSTAGQPYLGLQLLVPKLTNPTKTMLIVQIRNLDDDFFILLKF